MPLPEMLRLSVTIGASAPSSLEPWTRMLSCASARDMRRRSLLRTGFFGGIRISCDGGGGGAAAARAPGRIPAPALHLGRLALGVGRDLLGVAALPREGFERRRIPRRARTTADPFAHAAVIVEIGVAANWRGEVAVLAGGEAEVSGVALEVTRA